MRKKIIALLMAFTMTFCTTSVVFAVDTGITPLWENIIFITTYFNASGHAEGEAMLKADNFVYVRLELEEKNGSRWEKTGDYNVGSDYGYCMVEDDFTLDDGVDYRVKVIVNVYDDSYQLIETASKYSNVVTG